MKKKEILELDKKLAELGLRLLNGGDKESWSLLDDAGHALREYAEHRCDSFLDEALNSGDGVYRP